MAGRRVLLAPNLSIERPLDNNKENIKVSKCTESDRIRENNCKHIREYTDILRLENLQHLIKQGL